MGKVRGRRVKKDDVEDVPEENNIENDASVVETSIDTPKENESTAFFGLVDSNELTYFNKAEQTLNLNTFATPEERSLFIDSIFQEAKGKELKLVTNHICSKLMERLILDSTVRQIYQLFNAFNGKFYDLSRQKYSSHVIETFLVKVAALIEKEILAGGLDLDDEDEEDEESGGWVSMENMFLFIIGDFKPNLKKMIKDTYASHVLRMALLVMTGKELPSSTESNSILRSKKSKNIRKSFEIKDSDDYKKKFQVPASFKPELKELLNVFLDNETTESLRELAIDSIASPVVQVLIQLEGIVDRDRTIWKTIFNGDNESLDEKERAKEGAFVEYLLSNNIGSHFLQNAVENQKTKIVERIYNSYMKDRIVKLAKRETTGMYVVETMMEKLKSKQQLEILDNLVPQLNELIVNNIDVGSKIIDCSVRNNNYKKAEIVEKFIEFFNKGTATDDLFENVLKLSTSTLFSTKEEWPTSEERRRALLLEKLLEYDEDKILKLSIAKLMDFDNEVLLKFCKHPVFSHIVESILSMRETLTLVQRKQLLNKLLGQGSDNIVDLACDSTGSHIIDKVWMFTFKLNMYKERVARALYDNRDTIKITIYGRMVWKNWNMENYCRKFNDWKWQVKEEEIQYEEELKKKKEAEKEAAANADSEASGNKRKHDNCGPDEDGDKRKRGRGRGRR
jgi:nucleolar protein 9